MKGVHVSSKEQKLDGGSTEIKPSSIPDKEDDSCLYSYLKMKWMPLEGSEFPISGGVPAKTEQPPCRTLEKP